MSTLKTRFDCDLCGFGIAALPFWPFASVMLKALRTQEPAKFLLIPLSRALYSITSEEKLIAVTTFEALIQSVERGSRRDDMPGRLRSKAPQ